MAQQNLGIQDAATNMYDLAVLLAEGQSNVEETSWEAFIDNLSRITDAFADARVTTDAHEPERLITV
ncbi:MAG: hypothetical protein ABGY41_22360 [Candidatus Poribacteria bacterium]